MTQLLLIIVTAYCETFTTSCDAKDDAADVIICARSWCTANLVDMKNRDTSHAEGLLVPTHDYGVGQCNGEIPNASRSVFNRCIERYIEKDTKVMTFDCKRRKLTSNTPQEDLQILQYQAMIGDYESMGIAIKTVSKALCPSVNNAKSNTDARSQGLAAVPNLP